MISATRICRDGTGWLDDDGRRIEVSDAWEMEMVLGDLARDMALIVPLLILLEVVIGLIAWFAFGSRGGRGARFAIWLALVTLTLWCGSAAAFVLLNLLYFTLGSIAAVIGAVLVTAAMLAMPFGWAAVVRHHGTDAGSQPR
jgi:hypothetical protein